jgi:hypothetical protein
MKSFLSQGLVLVAGLAGVNAVPMQAETSPAEKAQIRSDEDPRVVSVRNFFRKFQSPAESVSDVFVREADNNGLDWRLLPGLAMVESGGGKRCNRHNLFGWANGKVGFSSFADAIRQVSWHLSNSRFYKDKTLDGLLLAYNRNPKYRQKVKKAMTLVSPNIELAMVTE